MYIQLVLDNCTWFLVFFVAILLIIPSFARPDVVTIFAAAAASHYRLFRFACPFRSLPDSFLLWSTAAAFRCGPWTQRHTVWGNRIHANWNDVHS